MRNLNRRARRRAGGAGREEAEDLPRRARSTRRGGRTEINCEEAKEPKLRLLYSGLRVFRALRGELRGLCSIGILNRRAQRRAGGPGREESGGLTTKGS